MDRLRAENDALKERLHMLETENAVLQAERTPREPHDTAAADHPPKSGAALQQFIQKIFPPRR